MFLRGIVLSNRDPLNSSVMKVQCAGLGNQILNVTYTSPYYNRKRGGFLALPEVGSEIIFFSDDFTTDYYYLATVVENAELINTENENSLDTTKLIPEKGIYTDEGLPQALTFQDGKGAGLKVSNFYTKDAIAARVELGTATGHKVLLSDSPFMDCIIMRNRDGDGITITSQKNNVHAANSIETKTAGTQRCIVRQGMYHVVVVDGRDLTLRNESTGTKRDPSQPEQYGNVNLVSKFKDVNIYTEEGTGRVLISSANSLVQIRSGGEIVISSSQGVKIKAVGNLDLVSEDSVNISGRVVNINSGSDINVQAAGELKQAALGNAILDGSQVHIKPTSPPQFPSVNIDITEVRNAYGK